MSSKYFLCGFAGGSAKGPHFIEPVYSDGRDFFVQVAATDNDTVSKFRKFNDEIDFFENAESETLAVGDRCIYGIMDSGQRLIYGDRDYVSRYVSQNMRRYVDTPYFLKECGEFTGIIQPELAFVETNQDLLELSVAANSIKEFARSEPNILELLIAGDNFRLALHPTKVDGPLTIFGQWLSFARIRNHKVHKSTKWAELEMRYLSIFDDDIVTANKCIGLHYMICRDVLKSHLNTMKTEYITDFDNVKYPSNIKDDVARTSGLVSAFIRHNRSEELYRVNMIDKIKTALTENKVNYASLALQFFFLSVVMKVTIEIGEKRRPEAIGKLIDSNPGS